MTSSPFALYRQCLSHFKPEEQRNIAHIKRFLEYAIGDPDFQSIIQDHPDDLERTCRERGLLIDPNEIEPLWPRCTKRPVSLDDLPADNPLVRVWVAWNKELDKTGGLLRLMGRTRDENPQFDAWRLRQIARCRSELGRRDEILAHSILAFELTRGCSVGCWFCAISAEPLKGIFHYTLENAALWRDVLEASVDLFGRASQTGVCYWATEPADNPDYLEFARDFSIIIGELPQMTTAVPLRNPTWTREVMRTHRDSGVPLRFSVLSPSMLRRIHETFTPEEQLCVKLLLYSNNKNHLKIRSGRLAEHLRNRIDSDDEDIASQTKTISGTIACVTGFLINMVERNMKLISPCFASNRWPLGYRVHAEHRFSTVMDFRAGIETMIDRYMNEQLVNDKTIAFREDLRYERLPNGFSLCSKYREHKIVGLPFFPILGDRIASGRKTPGEIIEELIDDGNDAVAAIGVLQEIFDRALLDDDPARDNKDK